MLHPQLPWYLAGPALGLCVIACRLVFNARLGVTGGYSEITQKLRSGTLGLDWRGWLLIGVLLLAAIAVSALGSGLSLRRFLRV